MSNVVNLKFDVSYLKPKKLNYSFMLRFTPLFIILMFTTPKINACEQPMIMAYNTNWSPYLYKVNDRVFVGTDLDILTQTLNKLSCNLEILSTPIERVNTEVQKGTIDIIIGASYTSKRNLTFYFSDPYRKERIGFAILATNETFSTKKYLAALLQQGNKVIMNMNGYFGDTVEKLKGDYPNQFIHEFKVSNRIKQLLMGDVDIVIADKKVLCRNKDRYSNNPELAKFIVSDEILHDDLVHFMFNRKTIKPEFVTLFNNALSDVLKRQTVAKTNKC